MVSSWLKRSFKAIVNYMGNPGLLLARMFLSLPVIRDISDPPSQYEIYELKNVWIFSHSTESH